MIIPIEKLLSMKEFNNMDKEGLKERLKAAEALIRAYTNNNFQNRHMRITVPVRDGMIQGCSPYMKAGDTIQISQSEVNDGLYEIVEVKEGLIKVDGELYDSPGNMVTKVVYPADVQKGVIDLMIWEKDNRKRVGIKSEELSRHSVTYFDQDSENQVMGYPVSLLGFLKPYVKARF